LIGSVNILSDITAYSLVRVESGDGGLKMTDLQCQVKTVQQCENNACTEPSSTVRDGEGRAFAASTRTLTVGAEGKWSTSECAAALGWKWNCGVDAERDLPNSASDPLIYDPAGGGDGVNVTVHVKAPGGIPYDCSTHLVQRVNVLYSGALESGKFATTGVAQDNGSEQFALDDGCGVPPRPVPVGAGTLRIIPAPKAITGGDTWDCPSMTEFEAALPNP
jgi:hypothetical protein